jgi:hypothetical protein
MDILKQYSSYTDNLGSLITLVIYNKKCSEVIKYLEGHLSSAQKITNPFKKMKINDKYYGLIQNLKELYEDETIINKIFLLHDKIFQYNLHESEIKTAIVYNFQKIIHYCESTFYVDYIIDLFYNFEFIYNIRCNKSDYQIIALNKNKERILKTDKINNEQKIIETIECIRKEENYKELIIISGNSVILDKVSVQKNVFVIKNNNIENSKVIYEIYENHLMKLNHQSLEKRLNDLQNSNTNLDLYVFGKLKFEIKDAIETYLIKELYIENSKLEKLKTFVDKEYFNFKIYVIKSLENGDIASQFIKNYNGIMGIKYF